VRGLAVQQLVTTPGEFVPLAGLRADGEQPYPWLGYAIGDLGISHPELGKLDEHLGLGVGDGACIDQHSRARPGWQCDGQGWSADAR
jgi:hypothetical protein